MEIIAQQENVLYQDQFSSKCIVGTAVGFDVCTPIIKSANLIMQQQKSCSQVKHSYLRPEKSIYGMHGSFPTYSACYIEIDNA